MTDGGYSELDDADRKRAGSATGVARIAELAEGVRAQLDRRGDAPHPGRRT
jgi:hypothetical protein